MPKNLSWINCLIIDDSRAISDYCKTILSEHFNINKIYSSDTAEAGLTFLTTNHNINLIIIDLNMPGVDGIELISLLGESQYKGYLVIMSGATIQTIKSVEQLAHKKKLNLLGSIQKPICLDAFDVLFQGLNKDNKDSSSSSSPLKIYEIIRAIDNNDIVVHYQPQVSIATREIVAVEALCRLQHPTKGLIYPDLFINMAEGSELIYHLTLAVIKQTFNDWKRWQQVGLNLVIGINISPALFNVKDFFAQLLTLCQQFDIPQNKVCIEVTEDILSNCDVTELEVLSRLSLHGFLLSLDDFGTGHATIERLLNLPFQQIKIDKSVFAQVNSLDASTTLIATTSGMAKKLNAELVIEGVETFEQWNIAKNNSCDIAQGYYISKPLSAHKFVLWHKHWTSHAHS